MKKSSPFIISVFFTVTLTWSCGKDLSAIDTHAGLLADEWGNHAIYPVGVTEHPSYHLGIVFVGDNIFRSSSIDMVSGDSITMYIDWEPDANGAYSFCFNQQNNAVQIYGTGKIYGYNYRELSLWYTVKHLPITTHSSIRRSIANFVRR